MIALCVFLVLPSQGLADDLNRPDPRHEHAAFAPILGEFTPDVAYGARPCPRPICSVTGPRPRAAPAIVARRTTIAAPAAAKSLWLLRFTGRPRPGQPPRNRRGVVPRGAAGRRVDLAETLKTCLKYSGSDAREVQPKVVFVPGPIDGFPVPMVRFPGRVTCDMPGLFRICRLVAGVGDRSTCQWRPERSKTSVRRPGLVVRGGFTAVKECRWVPVVDFPGEGKL